MSDDRRERILVRLLAILTAEAAQYTGDDAMFVYRDRAEFEDDELPAYILMDNSERPLLQPGDKRGPPVMLLEPQIFYIPKPTENRKNEGVAAKISQHRVGLVSAIMRDGPLQDLAGSNGYVDYRGMETDMQTGGEVVGSLKLDFAIAYVLDFNKL